MKVSLNWVKKYIDLPAELSNAQIAYDLTMRTVEVEDVRDTAEPFHDIVVGVIEAVESHPNADLLRVCRVDIGGAEPVQIVCGGANLYEGEKVVVATPGADVFWHGESELVKIKETKMRGVPSYGMICGASEVFLESFFPTEDPRTIVDLGNLACYAGQNIAEVVGMVDTVLEIDNKSLTNRPDLWGHYGIARELAAIYQLPLKPLPQFRMDKALPRYEVEISAEEKCSRYAALKIENVAVQESPLWLKAALLNGGMRPINALVDLTNYVMLSVGQPTHAFDSNHVDEEKIIVRNARAGEALELLDGADLALTETDLVICDANEPMALAGIRGGKKDSILPETTSVVLEVANFAAGTIRQTGKRFDEKTDASIRFEKGIDTERVEQGLAVALQMFEELFPEARVVAYGDEYPNKTERAEIEVTQDFLDVRLGKILSAEEVTEILTRLGYDVTVEDRVYRVLAPVWRSTGDVSIRDDVLGDLARLIGYENFEAKPLPVRFEHAVHQPKVVLERRIREYLAYRCGFHEVFTYPWIDEKYIQAARIDRAEAVRLATPPAPELATLRQSLVPGMLEAISGNLRYFDAFMIFEMAQVFAKGVYHPSSEEETLPVHKRLLTGTLVGKDAKALFYQAKGVLESLPRFCHMEGYSLQQKEKPSWADEKVYLNVVSDRGEVIGALGLVSVAVLSEIGVRKAQAAIFEIEVDAFVPLPSRSNVFAPLPQFPLVEEDLSLLVEESMTWEEIRAAIAPMVKELTFLEEYRGKQIPEGKKSVTLRFKIGNSDSTMTAKQIEKRTKGILKALEQKCGAMLREE